MDADDPQFLNYRDGVGTLVEAMNGLPPMSNVATCKMLGVVVALAALRTDRPELFVELVMDMVAVVIADPPKGDG